MAMPSVVPAPINPVDAELAKLLAHLHRGGEFGYWWTNADGSMLSHWWRVGQPSAVPVGRADIYFGVHPVREIPSIDIYGNPAQPSHVRSRIELISAVNCVFAEFDAQDFDEDKAAIPVHIGRLPFPPSIVIDSGGGYHGYWLTREPFMIESPECLERAKRLQAGWVALVGADKSAKDLARVLRVPGTTNYKAKYAPDYRDVRWVCTNFESQYEIGELENLIQMACVERVFAGSAVESVSTDRDPYARAAFEREVAAVQHAPVGARNDTLNRAAFALGQLAGAGRLDRGEVEAALRASAVGVGLGEREVEATIRSGLEAGVRNPRHTPAEPRTGVGSAGDSMQRAATADEDDFETPELPDSARVPAEIGADTCPWLDAYVDFSRKWSPRSFDGFHEAVALGVLSTIAARRVSYDFGRRRFTSLYLMLAGRTSIHAKSSATDIGKQVLRACGLDFLLAPDEATPQSFVRSLATQQLPEDFDAMTNAEQTRIKLRLAFAGQVGWFYEEFGTAVASMMNPQGVMADFRGLLRTLDDGMDEYRRSTIARGTERVERPYLALIANLTPADLRPVARRGAQLWGDGFLARFAFVTPPLQEIQAGRFPKGERTIPPEITMPLVRWNERLGIPDVEIESIKDPAGQSVERKRVRVSTKSVCLLTVADDAWEAAYAYHDALMSAAQANEQHDLDGNYGRFVEKGLRVAALLASLSGSDVIDLRHWARALQIAESWRLYSHRLYAQVTRLAVSSQAEIEQKIIRVVRLQQNAKRYADGMTAVEIARFIRGLGPTESFEYAERLTSVGALAKHRPTRAERYYVPDIEES